MLTAGLVSGTLYSKSVLTCGHEIDKSLKGGVLAWGVQLCDGFLLTECKQRTMDTCAALWINV